MGILDAPAIDRRSSVTSQFAALKSKLDRGLESASLVVLGDSTGVGATSPDKRWVIRFTEMLAANYPAYTVNIRHWNLTNNNYDAAVTVQTGTGTANAGGPFTLTMYNGSASGQTPTYSRQWLLGSNGMIPYGVMPDVLMVNHSHNMGTATDIAVVADFYELVRDALRWYNPAAAVIVVGQNPEVQGVSANYPTQHLIRHTRMAEVCATEGWGYINVLQAFLDIPGWATSHTKADGLHPNDTGSALWAQTVFNVFQKSGTYGIPSAVRPGASRIIVPGQSLLPSTVVNSKPAAGLVSGWLPGMAYTKEASTISASTIVFIPEHWRLFNVWVRWTTDAATTGNVVWNLGRAIANRVTQEMVSGATTAAMTLSSTGLTATSAAPGAIRGESNALLWSRSNFGVSGSSPNQPRSMALVVERQCANASDTYAGTAYLREIVIERAA